MEIKCMFKIASINSEKLYTCKVTETSIIEKDHAIKKFKGIHKRGKVNKNVKRVCFDQTNVNYFPRGLEKHFPNLTQLDIISAGIKEISKNDLKGLGGLKLLRIIYSGLTTLPDDLFIEMPNLREIFLFGNQIELTSSEFLKPLLGGNKVKVNLRGNKNISACYWPGRNNSTKSLEELMKLIDEKCIKPFVIPDPADFNPKLKEMWISGKFYDLTIIAGEKKFKVHKAVLGMRSQMFTQILEDQSEAAVIKIPEFSANTVEALLKFIYTNEISEDGDAKENFDIADKFKVAAMKTICEKIICEQVNKANAWETFLFAHRFSSQLLKEKAFHQIARNIGKDLPDELMEDPETLKKLLDAREVYDVARRAYEEILPKSKKMKLTNN